MSTEARLLTVCIACGSTRVKRRRVSVRSRSGVDVPDVQAEVCPDCGECYYDLEAMRALESAKPRSR